MKDNLITVGKEYHIDSAHFIPNHPFCGQIHGHTWTITILATGLPVDDLVIDFHDLNNIVNPLLKQLDHKLLNDLIPFPSVENLSQYLVAAIAKFVPVNVQSVRVKIQEGTGGFAIASVQTKTG